MDEQEPEKFQPDNFQVWERIRRVRTHWHERMTFRDRQCLDVEEVVP